MMEALGRKGNIMQLECTYKYQTMSCSTNSREILLCCRTEKCQYACCTK